MKQSLSCDIFCTVVDNYGDIGVSWRLARQLAREHGVAVRLWLDDLHTLQRLCPELDARLEQQSCRAVEVVRWRKDAFPASVVPADLVVEAFACELPESYVQAMAALAQMAGSQTERDARRQGPGQRGSTGQHGGAEEPEAHAADASFAQRTPVWVNLEYLSAEDWVDGCHKLPSPRPNLPLVKYFFFPGFTRKTGGLLLEGDLLARRDAFQNDPKALAAFWAGLGLPPPAAGERRVSLFAYENQAIAELMAAWAAGEQPLTCLLPEGRALPQVAGFFGADQGGGRAGDAWQRGNLRVRVLPFVEQARYDELLWACDVNFVRGEDSFVRAQWAGKPLIWQIYPQHDGIHLQKLRAFLDKYCAGLPHDAAAAVRALWEAWNGGDARNGEQKTLTAWNDFAARQSILAKHAQAWAQDLSGNSLALNLLDFFREIGTMRDFGNQT